MVRSLGLLVSLLVFLSLAGLVLLINSCSDSARRRQMVAQQAAIQARASAMQQQLLQRQKAAEDAGAAELARQQAGAAAAGATDPGKAGTGPVSEQDAKTLRVKPLGSAAEFTGFTAGSVEVMESMPPQFALQVTPRAPFELVLDKLSPMSKTGVFIAKVKFASVVTGRAPVPLPARISLGALKVGNYTLELHLSPAPGEVHAKVQSFDLQAR